MNECRCVNDITKREVTDSEETFAMTLLKEYAKQARRWFVIAIVILAMWLASIAGFIWYESQFEYVATDVDIDAEQDGGVNIAANGDVIYGAESPYTSTDED